VYRKRAHWSFVNWAFLWEDRATEKGMDTGKFTFEVFAGAVYSLGRILDETAKKVGIPRSALALALHKHYRGANKKWETEFWANAHSDDQLNNWMWKQKKPKFDQDAVVVKQIAEEISRRMGLENIQFAM